mmetsp:Transcript_24784/g.57748  ORF Transcript_24784/g.57748 Transcript_24784/m.57748 type:complete len:378 (+) Transcript_24784:50-1183(+)
MTSTTTTTAWHGKRPYADDHAQSARRSRPPTKGLQGKDVLCSSLLTARPSRAPNPRLAPRHQLQTPSRKPQPLSPSRRSAGVGGPFEGRGRRRLLLVGRGGGRGEARCREELLVLARLPVLEHHDARDSAVGDGRVSRARQEGEHPLLHSQHARGVLEDDEGRLGALVLLGLVPRQLRVRRCRQLAAPMRLSRRLEQRRQAGLGGGGRVGVHRVRRAIRRRRRARERHVERRGHRATRLELVDGGEQRITRGHLRLEILRLALLLGLVGVRLGGGRLVLGLGFGPRLGRLERGGEHGGGRCARRLLLVRRGGRRVCVRRGRRVRLEPPLRHLQLGVEADGGGGVEGERDEEEEGMPEPEVREDADADDGRHDARRRL